MKVSSNTAAQYQAQLQQAQSQKPSSQGVTKPSADNFSVGGKAPTALSYTAASEASALGSVNGVPQSPYYKGRIKADGKSFVGADGSPFTWRSVSEFLLPSYMNDPTRSDADKEATVAARLDERVKQGFSTVRVFGDVAWDGVKGGAPFENWEGYKANMEKFLQMAKDRGLYVELTMFTDVGKAIPADKVDEYTRWAAQTAQKYDNTFVEVGNESFKNGLSEDEVYRIGKLFKANAPDVMLAGSSPTVDGIDDNAGKSSSGHRQDGAQFGDAPFDYVTVHSERSDGDDGFRWVRHMREGEAISDQLKKPVVQDEPMGAAANVQPGRRDNVPRHFIDGALVAAVTGQSFTYHTDRAVTQDPNAPPNEPGVDLMHMADLIPQDQRGYHFVNGQWPESPFQATEFFDGNGMLRLFTKMKDDGSGFYSYPVNINKDIDVPVKKATHLKLVDVNTGNLLLDKDFAAGEKLHLTAGSDVVIYGGNAEIPKLQSAAPAIPPVDGGDQQVPAQFAVFGKGPAMPQDQANEVAERMYKAILGRPDEDADATGAKPWSDHPKSGDYAGIVNGLFTSSEFEDSRRNNQWSAAGLGVRMYQELLKRSPTQDELQAAVNKINVGKGGEVAVTLMKSSDFQNQLKGAPPADPSTDPQPSKPVPTEPIPAQGSVKDDKHHKYPKYSATQADTIVTRLYEGLFGREPDDSGKLYFSKQVRDGHLGNVVNALIHSGEFDDKKQNYDPDILTAQLYQAMFNRAPDDQGGQSTADLIRKGQLAQRVVNMVKDSNP